MSEHLILYGTQTGTAEQLACDLHEALAKKGIEADCLDMYEVNAEVLKKVHNLYIVVSTWGDGDPPDDAEDFHSDVLSLPDNACPQLSFAVFGLGDTGYDLFCQCGKDFDHHLERIGGKRIAERVDADIDFEEPFEIWQKLIVEKMSCLATH